MFDYFYTTDKGQNYLAQCQAGYRLMLTKGKYGSGYNGNQEFFKLSDLMKPLGMMEISAQKVVGNTVTTTVQFTNRVDNKILGEFIMNEIGLFGKLIDENNDEVHGFGETLIFYSCSENGDRIPEILTEFLINFPTTLSNVSSVVCQIDESLVYITKKEFDKHRIAKVIDHPDGSVTKAKLNDDVFKFTSETVYTIDISKVGSDNNILYITVPDITSYSDLNGKILSIYTSAYQCTWDTPQTVYVNVNGLGNKALRRGLPCNFADYDTKQYFTDKYCYGEIGRYQVLMVGILGTQFYLMNAAPPPRATNNIIDSTTDDTSYCTPKKVAKYATTSRLIDAWTDDAETINKTGLYTFDGDYEVGLDVYGNSIFVSHLIHFEEGNATQYGFANGRIIYKRSKGIDGTWNRWDVFSESIIGTIINPIVISDPDTILEEGWYRISKNINLNGGYYKNILMKVTRWYYNTMDSWYINQCVELEDGTYIRYNFLESEVFSNDLSNWNGWSSWKNADNALYKEIIDLNKSVSGLQNRCDVIQTKTDILSEKVFGESPQTWKDVQNIVRNGAASQYFDIGDQFVVERLSDVTAGIGESTGITAATVDADTFVSECGEVKSGDYIFTYDGKSWRNESCKIIKLTDYGIAIMGTAVAGDHVVVTETATKLTFDIIGIDHDTPADPNYTHSMTLQMHDLWTSAMQYDAAEAMYYIDEATFPNGLVAGTYCFTLPSYDTSYGGGLTFNFTLANDVPVGGQIRFAWGSQVQASTCKISTYASVGASTAIETVSVVEGEAGTALPSLHATSVTENANCAHRIKYGSNNWATSALRQWLNTDKDGGEWWEAKTVFDRPSSNVNTAGFLKGFDPAFLNVVGEVTKTTQESISDEYGLDASTERFFLLSRPEVYAGTERSADGADGTVYEYYGAGYSDLASPGTGADTNRIKYRNGSATYWWLRTPNASNGTTVRYVYPTGSLNGNSAGNSYGVAPACVIV